MPSLLAEQNISFARGMSDSKTPTAYAPDEAALLLNYRVTPTGDAEVRGGSVRMHELELNSGGIGYGAIYFTPSTGTTQWVAFVGDSAYRSTDLGVNWTQIATGLRQDYWSFATMDVGGTATLYCANGDTTLYSYDGTTWATETGPTTDCTMVAVHNERLWAVKGNRLYASKIADPTVWTTPDGLVLQALTHDGDSEITGVYSLGSILIVWKRRSMGYVDGYGNSDVIVAAGSRGISRDVGCIAFRSIVGVGGGDVMWMSERGFEAYTLGGYPQLVSGAIEKTAESFNWSTITASSGIPCALYYPRKRTYECWLPAGGSQNEVAFVYRLPVGPQPGAVSLFDTVPADGITIGVDSDGYLLPGGGSRVRIVGNYLTLVEPDEFGAYIELVDGYIEIAANDTAPASVFNADYEDEVGKPFSVGYDGFVRRMDTGTHDDADVDGEGGAEVGDRLLARPMMFGAPFRRKRARVIRVQAIAEEATSLNTRVYADGSPGTYNTVSIAAGVSSTPREGKARVSARGDTLQVEVTGAGSGTRISGVELKAELTRERP